MLDTTMFLTILIGVMIAGLLSYLFYLQRKSKTEEQQNNSRSRALQLQAYERLTLLVDRIAIPNLISRTGHNSLSAWDMQMILTKSIRDEFDYNITQQVYVTPATWNAVKGFKEKNLLLINQAAAALPPGATALDLNRSLLDHTLHDSKANLGDLVSEALSYEARKLL